MNSKELLEQATAKITEISKAKGKIEGIENTIFKIENGWIAFYNGEDIAYLEDILTDENLVSLRNEAIKMLIEERKKKELELEQLLGIQPVSDASPKILIIGEGRKTLPRLLPSDETEKIFPSERKPATINPEFEAATKDMFESVRKPEQVIINPEFEKAAQEMDQQNKQPDPVEDKLAEIIDKQEQEIKAAPLPGLAEPGYNPKKGIHPRKLPEAMTVEEVTRLRYEERKTPKEIAEHFGIKTSAVSNFIFNHDIAHRAKQNQKQPDETERP